VGVGRKIAEVRKQKGLSQKHIATKMNRTPQWLSNIERETRPISADELAQVANILGVSPSVFFNKELNLHGARYGARGITVCDEWKEFLPFYDWAMANGYEEGKEIDRIDVNKGYSPDNCRWVSRRENGLNKRNNRLITINGETRTLSEWAEISGINYDLLWYRVHAGWTGTDMLKPPRTSRPKTLFYQDEDELT
jgi:transcriptional regulator with XRE-family HTH domain